MTMADDLRREPDSDRDRERYACENCGLPLQTDDVCPECGGTRIVPLRELIDPAFRE